MIADRDLERVLTVIRQSGVAAELEDALRAKPGGAHRRLSVEMLFAACILVHGPGFRNATLVRIHNLLTQHLTVSTQFRHGIAWRSGASVRKLQIHQVRYLFKAVSRALDYSPHTAHVDGELLTQEQRIAREAGFDAFVARLTAASSQAAGTADVIAIDASSLPSWSRGARQVRATKGEDYRLDNSTFVLSPTEAWDPDGRWGYQTATHNKYDAKRFFGYQMLTVSTSFTKGSPEQPLKLITAMKLIPGNAAVAGPALRMIDSLMARQPVSEVIVDRGFSMATHDHWADPVLQRGLDQVFDLAEVQRGPVLDHQTGVMMIDGWPCAPWTPRHLHKIARPPHFALKKPGPNANPKHTAEYETNLAALRVFQEAQAELEQYALVPNGRRKANGTRHFFAPTLGRGTATATQRKKKVFQQATITIPGTVMPHLRQRLRWGSPAWIAEWNRRNGVESGYGNLKTLDGEGVQRGSFRVVGLAAAGLMATFAIVHYNLRMLRKWARTTGYTGDDIVLTQAPEVLGYEPVELHAREAAVEPPLAA